MNRLTTNEEFPHGAEGKRADKLTGYWCRGEFEATACVEKLSRYENTGLEPEEIEGMLHKWIPVAERLPESEIQSAIKERGEYAVVPVLVSAQKRNAEGNAYIVTDRAFYFERFGVKNFHNDKAEPMKVLAWMPLPEPYKEAEE
jgi:hypothetical protein